MIHIAIVDDNTQDVATLKSCLQYYTEKEGVEFYIDEFNNAVSFFIDYEQKYDIIFFDIEMPHMDGLEAAHRLRVLDKYVQIIFVTNMAQLAIKGYEVDALDFVVKPVNKFDFFLKMKRAVSRVNVTGAEAFLIHSDNGIHTIVVSHITYLEVNGHYVLYHTTDGTFSEYSTLKNAMARLEGSQSFVQCNRCYIVNLRYVQSITSGVVTVHGEELMISRSQKKPFIEAYTAFISGGHYKD